jgi:hypothetical protein
MKIPLMILLDSGRRCQSCIVLFLCSSPFFVVCVRQAYQLQCAALVYVVYVGYAGNSLSLYLLTQAHNTLYQVGSVTGLLSVQKD